MYIRDIYGATLFSLIPCHFLSLMFVLF